MQDIDNADVNINHLENIFTNETYYLAMKIVPLLERKVLYLSYIENCRLNDICKKEVHSIEKDVNINPFKSDLLYLYYISQNGIVLSSLEIEQKKHSNSVLMKNGIVKKTYKQEYVGVLECNYNTAFVCLTNAISNPRFR